MSSKVSSLSEPKDLLHKYGLQATLQRLAILETVTNTPHITAEKIITAARKEITSISRQAVFDTLNIFTDKGILRRIQPAYSPALYETRVNDNHHHLVCRQCAITIDVDCAIGKSPCLKTTDDHDFIIDEAEIIYWGTCPNCTKKTKPKRSQHI